MGADLMDLRPMNPYYRTRRMRLAVPGTEYTYPYEWIGPVTDRSQEDVEYVNTLHSLGWQNMTQEQRQEYLSGLRGAMNKRDFERIENNVQILLDVLETASESFVGSVPDHLTESYFQKLRDNVAAIRGSGYLHTDTPPVPELPWNTWQKYNDVEKILEDVHEVLSAQFCYFAGELYTGDTTGLLL